MNDYRISEMQVGMSASFDVPITLSMLDTFQILTGDINPLHTDCAFARQRGHPDRVAYGMLTASFYSTLVGVHLPGRYALLQGVDVSFVAPVYPGDVLTVMGEVQALHTELGQIEIRASIRNQHGKKVSRAKIRAGFSE